MSKNTIVISEYLQMKKPLQITSLNLSNQKLNKWPQEIFLCRNLRKLNLSKNQLDYIPKEISSLAKLRVLDLSDNNLSQIHTSVFLVPKLRVLNISNKKVELAVSSVVFLYAANIVWYFLTGVFEWGDPLGVYLIFIANGILGLILYVAVSLICYRKIKISPKNNRVLRICLIIITGIFFVWLVLFRLLPNFE